jgi:phosphohistidine phosphatase
MMDLFVMRHAKSAYPVGVADVDRPLSARGERNAAVAAQWLADAHLATALVSPAVRTRQTWRIVQEHVTANMRIVDGLYEATAADIAAIVDQYADGPTLVLGHNPGIQMYAISQARGDEPALQDVQEKFPTCAIAHLRDGQLTDFIIPR